MKLGVKLFFMTLIVFHPALYAEPSAPVSFDDLAALAVQNNLDFRESLWELEKSRSGLPGLWGMDEASLSLKGDVRRAEGGYASSASASLTVPMIDQLRLTGTVKADLSGQAGISLFPLAHSDNTAQARLSLSILEEKAVIKKIDVENSALGAALTWMASRESLTIQEALTDLREQEYRDARVRYETGEEVLDEVRRSLQVWSEAQSLRVSRQEQAQAAETALVVALGRDDITVLPLTPADLEEEILRLQAGLSPGEASAEGSGVVRQELLSRESLASTLKNTWAFSPTLQADLGVTWDDQGEQVLAGSVSLSFSLEDFQGALRRDLKGDLALLEDKAGQTLQQEEQKLRQILSVLDTTLLNREVAKLSLEESAGLAEEASLLYSLGEYSPLEREEAFLDHKTAALNYFQALSDQYVSWLNLRYYLY